MILDEEDHFVRFSHHTVKEFLSHKPSHADLMPLHSQIAEADYELATICLTYLHIITSKGRQAKPPKPSQKNLSRPLTPLSIVRTSVLHSESPAIQRSWIKFEKFLKSRHSHNAEILGQISPQEDVTHSVLFQDLQANLTFLAYASEHWLSHTANLTRVHLKRWNIWKALVVTDTNLATRPWKTEQWSTGDDVINQYIMNQNH